MTEPVPHGTRPTQRPEFVLARVVELGIDVIASVSDDLTSVLQKETLSTLRRMNLSVGLQKLAAIQTTQAFEVEWVDAKVKVPSLKERALRKDNEREEKKTLLERVASQLRSNEEPAYEIEETVDEIEKALTANPPQSVLLIGPSGVGKTAAVRQLARRWTTLGGKSPIYRTSGSRIVAGQTGFGMWEQRCQELIKGVVKKRAVLHVGALVELMEVGKSEYNHTGIATFLRPAISRGDLLCIAEATPEQLPLIEKQDPQLLDAFRHIASKNRAMPRGKQSSRRSSGNTPPQGHPAGRGALLPEPRGNGRKEDGLEGQRSRGTLHWQKTERWLDAALAAIDRLHRRYATYSAYPGRPLRFVENLLRDAPAAAPRSIIEGKSRNLDEEEVYLAFTRKRVFRGRSSIPLCRWIWRRQASGSHLALWDSRMP